MLVQLRDLCFPPVLSQIVPHGRGGCAPRLFKHCCHEVLLTFLPIRHRMFARGSLQNPRQHYFGRS